jgi:ABC-type transport system substrate-binding protein
MEQALEGDILKFGPRGTNEFGFTNPYWVDEPYYKGNTVESWAWTDPLTLVFKVRKGIKYSGKSVNPGVMQAREFVAGDFVYHIKRMQTSPNKGQLWDWIAETTAPDDYTWVVKF